MRCLVVADLHYSLPQFDWVLNAASHSDVVIIAGDALDIGSVVDFRAQIVVVRMKARPGQEKRPSHSGVPFAQIASTSLDALMSSI